jgi:hypothetical protein
MATCILRKLYTDPARPLTVAVGPDFGLVSMPAAVGTAALAALRSRRVRLGPVVADERWAVMRIGFPLAPEIGGGLGTGGGLEIGRGGRGTGGGPALGRGPETGDGPAIGGGRPESAGAEASSLGEWVTRSGAALGVRIGGRGTTATLPPLVPTAHGWLRWVVPPAAASGGVWTPAGELWAALARLGAEG